MKSFWISEVFLLLSVVELNAVSVSEFFCLKRNLTITVDDTLRLYVDGIEKSGLPNANTWHQPDVVDLPCTTRLIAIHGRNADASQNAGILASTGDDYVLTNSSWKCSNVSHVGWEQIDFDDSAWMSAMDLGRNEKSYMSSIPGITSNAAWIWLRETNGKELNVYCRKRLAPSYCLSSPCAFGGTCIDEPNGGYCICVPGYSAHNCSVVINYCESGPCVHGTCAPIVNGYVCQCSPGYSGDNCEYETNYCDSSPCVNGGSCMPIVNGYICRCPPGYTDEHCQYAPSYCLSSTCAFGSTCIDKPNGGYCICAPGSFVHNSSVGLSNNSTLPAAATDVVLILGVSLGVSVLIIVVLIVALSILCSRTSASKDQDCSVEEVESPKDEAQTVDNAIYEDLEMPAVNGSNIYEPMK